MTPGYIYIAISVGILIIGSVVSFFIIKSSAIKKSKLIIKLAEEDAELLKKEKEIQSKEKFLQLKAEHEKFINEKNINIQKNENKLKQKELVYSQKMEEVQRKQNELAVIKDNLNAQLEIVAKKQSELDKTHAQQLAKLESISGLSANEAKVQLTDTIKEEAKSEALAHMKDIVEEAKLTANTEAEKNCHSNYSENC